MKVADSGDMRLVESRGNIPTAPVALVFFNRPKFLTRTFEEVRRAQPSKLFLIQDGARPSHPGDSDRVDACRVIAEDVDWDCEVFRNYSSENLGTGRRMMSGLTWAFGFVNELIILEDDCLPAQDFFAFCSEVLRRYRDDSRIGMITGMNHLGSYDETNYDYLFATVGSIAGWATWKRVWDTVDESMSFLEDPEAIRLIRQAGQKRSAGRELIKRGSWLKAQLLSGQSLTSWSYQRGISDYLNSRLIVVPRVNLMSNIGVGPDGVHTPDSLKKVPLASRFLYNLPLHSLGQPLRHPKYVVEDREYGRRVNRVMGRGPVAKVTRRIESVGRRIIFGESLIDLLRGWVGRYAGRRASNRKR